MQNRPLSSSRLILVPLLALAGACASRGSVTTPVPADPLGDPELYALLAPLPLEGAAADSLLAYERSYPRSFLERIADVAEDPGAATQVRYNAVRVLGERRSVAHLPTLHEALRAPDLRVRAAAVAAAQEIMKGGRPEARAVAVAALDDRAPQVQAKALEVLGATDLPLLRDFLRRTPPGDVAEIARGLLQAAEERGYPLEPDSAGGLQRTAAAGHALRFTPVRRWERWDAAIGTVLITPAAGAPFRIDSVEVVRNVVPVAFSADGRFVAYEHGRRIFVRDLEAGAVRDLGPGLAPRTRPFAADLVFMKPRAGQTRLRENIRISYDVVRTPFEVNGDLPSVLGTVAALAQHDRHGNLSPVRWMRIAEQDLTFMLEAEGLETFVLPDPFAGTLGP